MAMKYPPVHYHEYLGLEPLLSCQNLRSVELNEPAHDEMLFIIVHQTYELWFKQILFELDSILERFSGPKVDDQDMGWIVARLQRILKIQRLMIEQIDVIETMTPMDFLEFRDKLYPASGFQSFQFRLLENKLGLKEDQRLTYNESSYKDYLSPTQAKQVDNFSKHPPLIDCIDQWLSRAPFLKFEGFDFWATYSKQVDKMFAEDIETLKKTPNISADAIDKNIDVINNSKSLFSSLLDPQKFKESKEAGNWVLSYDALKAALFIQVYRDQPALQQPFRMLGALVDLDENLTQWRYRHALMARRMLGTKIGTGGSSGFKYLAESTEKHRIFTDLSKLTTFFIPRSHLPSLPEPLTMHLGLNYDQ